MSDTSASGPPAHPRAFMDEDLRGSRFVRTDLSGAVMRAVDLVDADLDVPWMEAGRDRLLVNGVDVLPLVEAELDRRFPGRGLRTAQSRSDLVAAVEALAEAWERAIGRATSMPAGALDESVEGEYTFAQTVRHLIMAMDTWFGRAVEGREQPYHRLGWPNHEYAEDGHDPGVFDPGTPPFTDVRATFERKLAQVRDFLAEGSVPLEAERIDPWGARPVTVRSCLHVILREGWDHLRYALRDLDVLHARRSVDPA